MKKMFSKPRKRLLSAFVALGLLVTIGTAPEAVAATKAQSAQPLKVHYIDVGQADSILVQTPGGKTMLIDGGNREDAPLVEKYLKDNGVKKLDVLVSTHPHEDHIGGLPNMITDFPIDAVYMPKKAATTKIFEELLLAIKNKGLKINEAIAGKTISLDPAMTVTIVGPIPGKSYESLNDYSAVLRIEYGSTSFLLMGDAEGTAEADIISNGALLKSTVLKVGHHASKTSSGKALLKAVSPKYAIISVGSGNEYGHPADITIKNLKAAGAEVHRTDLEGTILCVSDGSGVKITPVKSVAKVETKASAPVQTENVMPVVPSKTGSNDTIVYITKTGEKYHVDGCSGLSRSKIEITLKDAKAKGYGPCKKCHPPQ